MNSTTGNNQNNSKNNENSNNSSKISLPKSALVIGADSALGKAIVHNLSNLGYVVYQTVLLSNDVLSDTSTSINVKTADGASNKSTKQIFQLDITDSAAIAKVIAQLPSLSFVTCAAASPIVVERFTKTPLSQFDRDWQINVRAQVDIMQQIIPRLGDESHILFILSELVLDAPQSYMHSYAVSKHALLGLMKTLASELASKKIYVNAISPGMMDTALTATIPSAVKKFYLQSHNRTSFVTQQEVADVVVKIIETKQTGKNYPVL